MKLSCAHTYSVQTGKLGFMSGDGVCVCVPSVKILSGTDQYYSLNPFPCCPPLCCPSLSLSLSIYQHCVVSSWQQYGALKGFMGRGADATRCLFGPLTSVSPGSE